MKTQILIVLFVLFISNQSNAQLSWNSRYVEVKSDGKIIYTPDEKGNVIPDFSNVGYYGGDKAIPQVKVAYTINPGKNAELEIQNAIEKLALQPVNKDGFRGAIVLKEGVYPISGSIKISSSGIVLRGVGKKTRLIAMGSARRPLIEIMGAGNIKEVQGTRTLIVDKFVHVGAKSFTLKSAKGLKTGDRIILSNSVTEQWIKDLQMDKIVERQGTRQWKASEYNFQFERKVQKIEGNRVFIDNPIVMELEPKYWVAEIYKYNFDGRISNVGVENLSCESEYQSDIDEDHSWDAILFNKIENGWVRNITAKHFANSCVNLSSWAKNITVENCYMSDHKSIITGSRRYSFNNNGQQNLFINCHAEDGRHDFVTGARVCGPNVFYNCTAKRTHSDIGPHHRWAMGTLYDNIITDGDINVQDRGYLGSGHGWAGVTQVVWNCTVRKAAIQSPWISGKNYVIGLIGQKSSGFIKERHDGCWEGQNKKGLEPPSLYKAQLKAKQNRE